MTVVYLQCLNDVVWVGVDLFQELRWKVLRCLECLMKITLQQPGVWVYVLTIQTMKHTMSHCWASFQKRETYENYTMEAQVLELNYPALPNRHTRKFNPYQSQKTDSSKQATSFATANNLIFNIGFLNQLHRFLQWPPVFHAGYFLLWWVRWH